MHLLKVRSLESTESAATFRFVSGLNVRLEESGKPTSWVTITRTGRFSDPRYGQFEISREMLLAMVENFNKRTYGQDIFIDVAHRPDNGAAAKIVRLTMEGDRLRAQVEWTSYGVEAVKDRGYTYLSAEFTENFIDNENGAAHGPVLLGAGLTVRPVIKRLDPVTLSLSCDSAGEHATYFHPELEKTLTTETHAMWKQLSAAFAAALSLMTLSDASRATLLQKFDLAVEKITDEPAAKAVLEAFKDAAKQLSEQVGDKTVNLSINIPDVKHLSADDIKRMIAEARQADDSQQKQLAEKRAASLKLLGDTINAAKDLGEDLRKELASDVADLITPEMSDEQVRRLAENQIRHGNRTAAAQKLANMGWRPGGSTHITVDDSNTVKALQETIDRRLGILDMPDARRFERTAGRLDPLNKQFVEKVLAEFDAANGARLHREHKLLAGGDGIVSDVAVPAVFERTVIREALYQLIGLQFVDIGTLPFSATALVPYSYRDTIAAGRSGTRSYEGQGIKRAGIKQVTDTAYPIPQKLAFEVSDEMRYLTSNGQLQWDTLAENTNNASRIIGEDLEKLIFDEVLNASDEFGAVAVAAESLTGVNGTNKVFVLVNFPVVRPRKIFDLQGAQVGATINPVVVNYAGTPRNEYDGSNTQAAGTYYVMDYNLGEIYFVTELGAIITPPNATAITVAYSRSTNVTKFDTDLGTLTTDAKWDDFLYRFGLRKAVIENDRYYSANFGLMSGTVRTQIEQARQFAANYARPGTDLSADGNLGRIKDLPQFRTTAPGLAIADQRVVVGARAQTRFRLMKPWAMNALENQKDSNGRFTGKKEAYGDQFIVLHTPTPLKNACTSMVLYSATARVNRVA